jgi:hypothetical protein
MVLNDATLTVARNPSCTARGHRNVAPGAIETNELGANPKILHAWSTPARFVYEFDVDERGPPIEGTPKSKYTDTCEFVFVNDRNCVNDEESPAFIVADNGSP